LYTTQIERGIVRKRVVFVPRSVEIRPLFSELIVAEQAEDVLGLILLYFSYSLQPCSRVGMEGGRGSHRKVPRNGFRLLKKVLPVAGCAENPASDLHQ
jgi:hypothetical protein